MSGFRRASFLLFCVLLLALFLNACTNASTGNSPSTSSSTVLNVVAGENFWSSIATQLGGSHVNVTSIVSDPNADPHQYESSTNDARAFAQA
jgi:zinc/manganese transport system substrate-binding protein